MNTEVYPRLRHFTMVSSPNEDSLSVIVGTEQFEISELSGSREKFLEVKSCFDGRHSIGDIAAKTGVATGEIREIIEMLSSLGIMRNPKTLESATIPTTEFLEKVESSCIMWQRQIGFHRLFSLLAEKKVRKEVFIGYLLESYHYVHSAGRHIATAISNCKNGKWEKMLKEYFVDEYDHGKLYLASLEKMGFTKEHIITAHPLIGTMSLINMLCEIARTSTLSYLACTSLFEANKNDFHDAKSKMEAMAIQYDIDPAALSGIISHMEQDINMDHKSLLRQAISDEITIDSGEAHFAVNCLHDLKHSFDQFHDQILQYYTDISNYIPRLKVDYFSL